VEEACDRTIQVAGRTQPDPERIELYNKYYRIYRSLYPSLRDHFAEIARIIEPGP